MDKQAKMLERLTAQAFSLIELAASEGRRKPEQRADAAAVIQGQLRVLGEIGVKAGGESST